MMTSSLTEGSGRTRGPEETERSRILGWIACVDHGLCERRTQQTKPEKGNASRLRPLTLRAEAVGDAAWASRFLPYVLAGADRVTSQAYRGLLCTPGSCHCSQGHCLVLVFSL